MNLFLLLLFPTQINAGFFNNYTNLVRFSYNDINCAIKPSYVNVTNTISCFPYQNISMCCKYLMKKHNFSEPLNICYNNDGKSSFSSCYEQQLSPLDSNTIGILSVLGIILIIGVISGCMFIITSKIFSKKRNYSYID